MSSTIFGPVFSVGASAHPIETLDIWAESAGGAQRRRPAPLRPARAEKFGWRYLPSLPLIDLDRTAVVERLMRPLGVVEPEILANPQSGLARIVVVG